MKTLPRLVAIGVVLAAGLYLFWPRPAGPLHDVSSDVRRCKDNLFAIHAGLVEYTRRFGHPPTGSGPSFLAQLIQSGVWEDTPENRARLTCPGPYAAPVPGTVDYRHPESLGPEASAYAARDTRRFPLAKFPSGGTEREPIVACDNSNGMNHDGVMNVLYSDRTIETLHLDQEIARGRLPPDSTTIAVGPGAAIEALRKLSER